jgi:predicted CXXCH cytochrome family protein
MFLAPGAVSLLTLLAFAQQPPAGPRAKTQSPHGTLALSCENCHTFTAWKPIRNLPEFNHDKTRYPLRGMHESIGCTQCHTKLVFTNVGHTCSDCHADLHRGQFGANCQTCHTVKGWRVSIERIQQHQNRFPLVGAHAVVECEACHRSGPASVMAGLSTVCYSCHARDFQTKVFDHTGFPVTCNECHSVNSWFGASFDHAKFAGFALTGVHATIDCRSCHVSGFAKGTPITCFGCHAKDYNGAANPNHAQAGFPRDCSICHTTASWAGAKFDHAAFTGFALTGMHATLQCAQCHLNGKYAGTPADCGSCHMKDYNGTTNPNHKAAGFPVDCSICHTTQGWQPASFDHSKSGFPLTGAHANVACATCHVGGNFTNLSTACSSCHMKDYNSTTNPNHIAAKFPTDCQVCHSTTAWQPASFDHSKTAFPLTGAHVNVACANCHINGVYAGTPTDCYSCHRADYTGTTNPNHIASQFPTTCATCHTAVTWAGATFNHTWFPIYSGSHAGKWTTCGDCHVNSSNYAVFSCITCHTHDASVVVPQHSDVRNFVYTATSCYSCHATGQGGN